MLCRLKILAVACGVRRAGGCFVLRLGYVGCVYCMWLYGVMWEVFGLVKGVGGLEGGVVVLGVYGRNRRITRLFELI